MQYGHLDKAVQLHVATYSCLHHRNLLNQTLTLENISNPMKPNYPFSCFQVCSSNYFCFYSWLPGKFCLNFLFFLLMIDAHVAIYFFQIYLFVFKEFGVGIEKGRAFIHWFLFPVASIANHGLEQRREPGASYSFSTWVERAQMLVSPSAVYSRP